MVLENSTVIGTGTTPAVIGRKVVFGHRNIFIGATIGDLCEIGNSTIIMPGATIGNWCITGEGTFIPELMTVPDRSVIVGRPGRVIRSLTDRDRDMIKRMRGDDTSLEDKPPVPAAFPLTEDMKMDNLFEFMGKTPEVGDDTFLFDSAEINGNVIIGAGCIIGAGVKIIGDSHGPVRIGNGVQILENTVLHLLPDNELVIEDDVIIGPGCMIHGCRIGRGSLIEPGAIVCDYSNLGENTLVKAGSLVKQQSEFSENSVLEGFPAVLISSISARLKTPEWALSLDGLESLRKVQ